MKKIIFFMTTIGLITFSNTFSGENGKSADSLEQFKDSIQQELEDKKNAQEIRAFLVKKQGELEGLLNKLYVYLDDPRVSQGDKDKRENQLKSMKRYLKQKVDDLE